MPRAGALAVTATVPGNTSGSNASNRLIATAFGTQANGGPGGMATTPSRWFASNAGQPEIWETDGAGTPVRGRNFGDLRPPAKGGIASRAMLVGTEVMAAELEVVVDPAVSGKKALRVTR